MSTEQIICRLIQFATFGVSLALAQVPAVAQAEAPDDADLEACAFLASLEPARIDDFVVKSVEFDVDGDGKPEQLTIADEGTMHVDVAQIAINGASPIDIEVADDVGLVDDDWGWVLAERLLIHSGRAYLLHFQGWETGYLRFAGRIGPDFTERPLCKFEPVTDVLMAPAPGSGPEDKAVCDAVSTGSVSYKPLARYAHPRPVPGRDILAGHTRIAGEARVDAENIGDEGILYLYEADSSAGAGCDLRYFDTAPDDAGSLLHQRLVALQGLDLADVYPRRTCVDARPRWFVHDGVTFLETRSRSAAAPKAERDEYHWVDAIEGGVSRRVCAALYLHRPPRVIGVWDGQGLGVAAREVTGARRGAACCPAAG